MLTPKEHTPQGKIWLEHKGKPLVGKGGANTLKTIRKTQSTTKTARQLNISYKYV